VIILFTDFTYNGPYVGQLKAVIYKKNHNAKIIDLMHDAPAFKPQYAGLLLNSIIQYCPANSVFCCVIDPGVGSQREAIVIETNGHYFVGPDNGLFEYVVRSHTDFKVYAINWQPDALSNTFHGRDIFAPIASEVCEGNLQNLKLANEDHLKRFDWDSNLQEIIYIDSFGNLMTGIKSASLTENSVLEFNGQRVDFVTTFSKMQGRKLCWYKNSNGLVELAINSQHTAKLLNARLGDVVSILE